MVGKLLLLVALHGFYLWCLGSGQVCNSLGFICTTCESLQLCTDSVPTSANLSCPTGTYCDSTSSSYCSSTVCTTEPLAFYNCTETGRFAVGTNCSQYVFCSNSTTLGILVPTLFDCPTTTLFDPSTATCVLPTAYTCPDDTTTTTVSSTTDPCLDAGRFANTTDTTCQSYYYCFLETNGTYTLKDLTCPTTTVFDPVTAKCVLSTAYTCTN